MFKRRPEYFAVAALGGIMTIAASVFMAMSLDSGISEPDRRSMKRLMRSLSVQLLLPATAMKKLR